MYRIVREFELRPGVWNSKPIPVGSSPNRGIADRKAAELNEAERQRTRRLRSRFRVIAETTT